MGDAGRGREEQGDVRGKRHFSAAVLPGGKRQLLLVGERGRRRQSALVAPLSLPGETFFFFVGELFVEHDDPSELYKPPVDYELGCSAVLPGQ